MPRLLLVLPAVVLAGVGGAAWGQPSPGPAAAGAAPPVVLRTCRSAAPYFESSAFATARAEQTNGILSPPASALLARLAAGLELRDCRGATSATHLRFGLTLAVAGKVFGGEAPGAGVETEASYPVTDHLRVGARLGADRLDAGTLVTFGVRLRFHDLVYVGVDGFHGFDLVVPAPRKPRTSGMIGIGFEGRAGIPLSLIFGVACGYAVLNSINLR